MQRKTKFVYAKPFYTHETFGIKNVPKIKPYFNMRHDYKKRDETFIFYKNFYEKQFHDWGSVGSKADHKNHCDIFINETYKNLLKVFGKPIKITMKEAEDNYNFLSIDDGWVSDVIWYILLHDQKHKGKTIYTPVTIRNYCNNKNHHKMYSILKNKYENNNFNETFGDDFRLRKLEKIKANPIAMNSKTQSINDITEWRVEIGGTYEHERVNGERCVEDSRIHVDNLIKEFK